MEFYVDGMETYKMQHRSLLDARLQFLVLTYYAKEPTRILLPPFPGSSLSSSSSLFRCFFALGVIGFEGSVLGTCPARTMFLYISSSFQCALRQLARLEITDS